MGVPNDRRYLKSHEWHKLEGDICTIGISQFAADELTDITYISLPATGKEIVANEPIGEIESVKATSELLCGVSGVITEVNDKLEDAPELINDDPFGEGWMIRVKVPNASAYDALLSAEVYETQLGEWQ